MVNVVQVLAPFPNLHGDAVASVTFEEQSAGLEHLVGEHAPGRFHVDNVYGPAQQIFELVDEVDATLESLHGVETIGEDHGDVYVASSPGSAPGLRTEHIGSIDVRLRLELLAYYGQWNPRHRFGQPRSTF